MWGVLALQSSYFADSQGRRPPQSREESIANGDLVVIPIPPPLSGSSVEERHSKTFLAAPNKSCHSLNLPRRNGRSAKRFFFHGDVNAIAFFFFSQRHCFQTAELGLARRYCGTASATSSIWFLSPCVRKIMIKV